MVISVLFFEFINNIIEVQSNGTHKAKARWSELAEIDPEKLIQAGGCQGFGFQFAWTKFCPCLLDLQFSFFARLGLLCHLVCER